MSKECQAKHWVSTKNLLLSWRNITEFRILIMQKCSTISVLSSSNKEITKKL